MNESVYNKFVQKLLKEIKENNKILEKAVTTELQDSGHKIDLEYINAIFENKDNVLKIDALETQKIAVSYNGDIEITVQMILFALKNNLEIHLFADNSKIINACFITLILESLKDSKIENKYIYYKDEYNENYLRKNQNEYNYIAYIGEPFEYEKFKYFIKKPVFYYNYKAYKIYINQNEFNEEYKEIMKFAYMQNIYVDIYDNKEDFINDVQEIDKVIIYIKNENEKDEFSNVLKTKEIIYNEFPYDEYRFKINDLMVKLV